MSEPMFVQYREYNDHEGESWTWWLQRDGNEEELAMLADILDGLDDDEDDDPSFVLYLGTVEPESVVDKLVEYAESGYYAAHNKVTGVLDVARGIAEDALYKGGIRGFFSDGEAP